MSWTDGTFFDFERGSDHPLAYVADREQFPKISRNGMAQDCHRRRIDINPLAKVSGGDVDRKFYPGDFGWYEVPFEPTKPKAKKAIPLQRAA